jgi:hypothetical protein
MQDKRNALRTNVVQLMTDRHSVELQRAAIHALETINVDTNDSFQRLTTLFASPTLRPTVVHALLKVPIVDQDSASCTSLANELVALAEATPADKRTDDSFLDVVQLVDRLLPRLAPGLAIHPRRGFRAFGILDDAGQIGGGQKIVRIFAFCKLILTIDNSQR